MLRSFFIDLENVRSYGLEGILLLKPDDKVYVFYSDNANTLTIPTIESLNESSASVKYIKTNYTGANAMDFQIVTLLGASIEKEKEGRFYIISHDNGFRSAVKFCEGYFTGYDIVTGVFANILLALNSEKNQNPEKPAKEKQGRRQKADRQGTEKEREQKKAPEKQPKKDESLKQVTEPETKPALEAEKEPAAQPKKNSRRRRRSGSKDKERIENQPEKTVENAPEIAEKVPEKAEEKATDTEPAKAPEAKDRNRQGSRRRQSGRDKNRPEKTEGEKTKEAKPENNGQKADKPGNPASTQSRSKAYVYNALSDFLSQKTIDMYASKIDEGIRASANRNELHEFFKKSYGQDEAEALYKIIYADFDKMKKEAGK